MIRGKGVGLVGGGMVEWLGWVGEVEGEGLAGLDWPGLVEWEGLAGLGWTGLVDFCVGLAVLGWTGLVIDWVELTIDGVGWIELTDTVGITDGDGKGDTPMLEPYQGDAVPLSLALISQKEQENELEVEDALSTWWRQQ